MFRRIKTFLQEKRTKKQLKNVLQLLYSNTKHELGSLIDALHPKDEIEKLEYYIIIERAAKLKRPFTDDDITAIWQEQVKALEGYVSSKELRENVIELAKVKVSLSMLHFNVFMDRLRRAYEFNKSSPGGMLLSVLIAKGRPLTQEEEVKVDKSYKELKMLDDMVAQKEKELEEHVKKMKQ